MKARFLSAVVALLVSGSAVMAQDASSISAGSKAILFTFQGLNVLGVGTFNGGIGGKFFLSSPLAVRAAIQFASSNTVLKPAVAPTAPITETDGSNSSTTFGVSAGVEYHFLTSRVSPYAGAEVLFSNTSTESKNVVTGNPPPAQTVTKNAIGGGAGTTIRVSGIAGVEFFLTKELSLGGEYQLGLNMVSRPDQEQTTGPTTTTTPVGGSTVIGIGTAALTLSVYF
jgi:hypothetical protein